MPDPRSAATETGAVQRSGRVQAPVREARAFGQGSDAVRAEAERRAEPPRAPVLPPALVREENERLAARAEREALERRSMLRGLLLLALVVLLISFWRAGLDRVLPAGWWRRW